MAISFGILNFMDANNFKNNLEGLLVRIWKDLRELCLHSNNQKLNPMENERYL